MSDVKDGSRFIYHIAQEISEKWKNPSYCAKPYIEAMRHLSRISDVYITEDGTSIVLRFLFNSSTWRGEDARRIKAELKALVK